MRPLAWIVLASLVLVGCAYRRHTTPLHLEPDARVPSKERPGHMYTFRLISARVDGQKISGLPWDDDGSGPDPFVRLHVAGRLIWESEVKENQVAPEWNAVLPRNVVIGPESPFRLELWDWDTAISADPIGRIERTGLPPTVVPDAIARLQLDNKGTAVVMITAPRAHRGVGVTVEVRSDALKVLAVEPYSPGARAGIKVGDLITGIASERVEHMDDADAMSELSMASERGYKLTVADAEGLNERDVILDKGYVWLVM
jgi:PDZ domain/C2 domain